MDGGAGDKRRTVEARRPNIVDRAQAFLILARPRMLPLLLGLVLFGFAVAQWDEPGPVIGIGRLIWMMVSWSCLHAFAMWANAKFDRDAGPILFGEAIEIPAGIGAAIISAVVVCLFAAQRGGLLPIGIVAVGLAEVYSSEVLRLKAHPVGGPLVNIIGYGTLSPLAGYLCSGISITRRAVLMWPCVCLAVLGIYFAAQIFQGNEDRDRGYRTFVVQFGRAATVRAVSACLFAAAAWAGALVSVGVLPRVLVLCVPPVIRLFSALDKAAARPQSIDEVEVRRWISLLTWIAAWAAACIGATHLVAARAT